MRKILLLVLVIIAFQYSCNKSGSEAPDFKMQSLDGKEYTMESLKGKIVVMNVWATWCGTCINELPALNKLASKYQHDEEVVFLAFSDEPTSKVIASLLRFPFYYTHFTDAERYTDKLQSRLVKTYPQNLIIDQNSVVVFDHSDGSSDIYEELDTIIQDLKES